MYYKWEKTRNGVLRAPFKISNLSKLYDIQTGQIIVRYVTMSREMQLFLFTYEAFSRLFELSKDH